MNKEKYNFFVLLIGAFLLEASGYIAFPYIALQLKSQYGLSSSFVGGILLIALWVRPLASLAGGIAAERLPYLWIFIAACLMEGFCFLSLGLSSNVWVAILGVIVGNIGFSIWTPNLFALVYEWFPQEKQFEKVAKLNGAVNGGAAAGCLVGAVISNINIKAVFLITAAAYVLVIPILGLVLRGKRAVPKGGELNKKILLRPNLIMVVIALTTVAFWSSYGQFNSFFSVYVNDWLGNNAITGIAFGAVALGVSGVSYLLGMFGAGSKSFSYMTVLSAVVFAVGWASMTAVHTFAYTGLFILGIIFGEAFFSIYLAEQWEKTNPGRSHMAQGFNFTLRNIGMGAGSYFAGLVYEGPGGGGSLIKWGALNVVILSAAAAAVFLLISKNKNKLYEKEYFNR